MLKFHKGKFISFVQKISHSLQFNSLVFGCFLAILPLITFTTSLFVAEIAREDKVWERGPFELCRPSLGIK